MAYSIDRMPERISIGRETETGVTDVMIDCGAWVSKWPGMTLHAIHTPEGGAPYILQTETDGSVLVWHVTDADTATPGTGLVEIVGETDGRRKVSAMVKVYVAARMSGTVGEPPEAAKPWADRVVEAADRITGMQVQATTLAEGSGATAEWNGEQGMLTIGVPKGKDGKDGADGKDAVVDATLTKSGQAADAKATGEAVGQLKDDLGNLTNATAIIERAINKWKPTATGGYYTQYGSYNAHQNYAYQELNVNVGDVINAYYWDGTQYIAKDKLISYVTPYSGTSVKGAKGTTNAVTYTVPDEIDKVILSINISNNPNNICVLVNNTEVPTEMQTWSEADIVVPKIDDSLTKSGYFADSKKVGDTFAEFNGKFSNDGYRIGMITAENEVQDKRNAEHEYYIHEADSLRHLVSELQNQIDTINPPIVLDSGACGENLTWELLSNGLLHISGTGRSYDFIKGVQIGKTLEQIRQYVIDNPDHPEYGEREGATYHEYTASDGTYIGYVAPWYRYRPENEIGVYVSQKEYDKWNPNHWTYNRIKIDDGITYVGDWMFYRVCGATELVIPEGVTALGQWAIRFSTSLEIVKLPRTLKSIDLRGISRHEKALKAIKFEEGLESLGDYAFTADKHLHTLILPSTLTTAGLSMCESDNNLVYVDCGGLIKIPDNAFVNCTSLEKVKIGESCTEIGSQAFFKCALKELKIPSSVSIIANDAFAQCKPKFLLIDSPTIASLPLGKLAGLFSYAEHIYVKNGLSVGGSILNSHKKVGTYCGYDYYIPKTN